MSLIKRLSLALLLALSLSPAFGQVPPPVPALPDAERRTSYSITGTNCACAVNFALYGDSTDYQNWIEVWLNGVQIPFNDPTKGWTITTPSGSLATLARPITNAVLTFNNVQTGTVQIVGSRRPRRTTQFNEATGVPTRNLNQAFTDVIAMQRETWDKTNDTTGRAILGLPGEIIGNLPPAASRASSFICWDVTGLIPGACGPLNGQGNVVGPNSAVDGHIALFSGSTGLIIRDGGAIGTGDVTGPAGATASAFVLFNGATGKLLKNGPTIIPLASGGTNNALTASNGGIAYSDAAGLQILGGTPTATQMLQSGTSAAPAWSTSTWPATTTINQLLYSSSANAVAGLATGNNGALITSGVGVPSISSTLPAAVQLNITQLGIITAGTWNGTTLAVANGGTGGTAASGTLLDNITGFASTGYVKRTGAGTYAFNNPIPLADGGCNAALTASNGGLLYSTASACAILAGTGTPGQIPLSGTNAAPAWSTTTWPNTISANNLLWSAGSNAVSGLATGNNGALVTSAGGVPSISSTLPTAVQSNITQLGTIGAGIWNGTAITGTFIATNTVANSNLAQSAGPTIKGNPNSGAANQQDFAVQSLTNKPVPNANNDFLLLYDATTGTFKNVTPGQLVSGTTAGVSSLNGLTGGLSIAVGNNINLSSGGSTVTVSGHGSPPEGRLTLQTGVPVMITTQSNKATLFYDCSSGGSTVPYFNGTIDQFDTIAGCEVSDAMVSAASAGQVVSGQVYDAWWVHGGANRICLAMSVAVGGGGGWASDVGGTATTRGTGYTQLDISTRGYWTNKNSITNCFNAANNYGPVAVNQGTYLGTILATANGQTGFVFGASSAGGTAAQLYVWNAYNRVTVTTTVKDSTASWTYGTNTVRPSDNSTTNRVSFVSGLAEDGITASFLEQCNTGATLSNQCSFGLSLDGTTVYDFSVTVATPTSFAQVGGGTAVGSYAPQLGSHFIQALENSEAGTSTFIGGSNGRYGFIVQLRM